MKAFHVFETTAVDVGADRLSCVIAMPAASRALGSATTAVAVVSAHSTPPVGTPGPVDHEGNSAPARAPVAGVWESERSGEHGGAK